MTDRRDALPLLYRGRAHQRTGAGENNLVHPPFVQLIQQQSTQHRRTASASGCTGVDILPGVKQHRAAILMHARQVNSVPLRELTQQAGADLTEVSGVNPVIVRRMRSGVAEQTADGLIGRGRHRRPHIIRIRDAVILYPAERRIGEVDAVCTGRRTEDTGT